MIANPILSGFNAPLMGVTDGESRYTFDRVVRMVLSAATLIALVLLLRHLSNVLLPFAAAVVLAYLLNPLVTLFESKTKHRGLAVAITLGGLGVVALAIVAVVLPLAAGQVSRFQGDLRKLRDDLPSAVQPLSAEAASSSDPADGQTPSARSATGWLELKRAWGEYRAKAATIPRSKRLAKMRDAVSGTFIGDALNRGISYAQSPDFNEVLFAAAKRILAGGWTVVTFATSLVLGLTGVIIVILYLVFLLVDFPEYARVWPTFLPPRYRDTIVAFLGEFNVALRRYFRGQALVAMLMGLLFSGGFSIMGLPMAVPLGLFIGLLNMVPYLQTVGLVPALLLASLRAIEQDSSFLGSVGLTLAVFAVAQLIQDALITPRVMGKATGLKPLAILLGLFIWGKLLGFLGLILAIPLTCLGIAYYRRFVLLHAPDSASPSASA